MFSFRIARECLHIKPLCRGVSDAKWVRVTLSEKQQYFPINVALNVPSASECSFTPLCHRLRCQGRDNKKCILNWNNDDKREAQARRHSDWKHRRATPSVRYTLLCILSLIVQLKFPPKVYDFSLSALDKRRKKLDRKSYASLPNDFIEPIQLDSP